MKMIFEKAVSWDSIGDYPREAFTYTIDRAVIHKDTGVLSIDMTLNFVMPHLDIERMKGTLIHKLPGITGVKINYTYQDVILCREDIAMKNFEYVYYATPNKAVYNKLDKETQENKTIFPDEETLNNCEIFRYLDEDSIALYNKLWKELKSK